MNAFPRNETVAAFDVDLTFQVTDWHIPEKDNYGQKPDFTKPAPRYEILMFGCTDQGDSVCASVTGFEPSFFIKLPEQQWKGKSDAQIRASVASLKQTLLHDTYASSFNGTSYDKRIISNYYKDHLAYVKVVKRKDFWGFNNFEWIPFVKIKVRSLGLFNGLKRYFKTRTPEGYVLYETNIDPFIRFIHEQRLNACGWVRLKAGDYEPYRPIDADADADAGSGSDNNAQDYSRAVYNVTVPYTRVQPHARNKIAPLLVASFDIECTSSHGDFPQAKKTYLKLAQDLGQIAKFMPKEITPEAIERWIFQAFTKEVKLDRYVTVHRLYPKSKPSNDELTQKLSSISGQLCAILHRLSADGRKSKAAATPVAAEGEGEGEDNDNDNDDDDDHFNMTKLQMDVYEKEMLVILGKTLPGIKGDPIIQIGTTVHRYGSDEIVYRHIVTLKSCADFTNCDIESYDTEQEVLIAWKELMQRLDPDVLIGYNIFGFDMEYVWRRAEELGVTDAFSHGLGRLSSHRVKLVEQKLSSSALGDNILKFFSLSGVVCIDMLKYLQREQKLDSYKLDNVASIILGDNKNDLKPKEIFEKFLGDADDRAEIAQYCIQDCVLVNRLLSKLKVLENNVGMGNVCHVPLSFLFMRGQGIKIFSLVAKECREQQMVIPDIRDTTNANLLDEDGYEGAIVLVPQAGIYLDAPISVLDFASLYPTSMIERNLSHDCYVLDDRYRNIEGVEYLTVRYDIYEGVADKKTKVGEKECTFAQLPEGKKGIIPNILLKLIDQRKNTRKKIEYETVTCADGKTFSGLVKTDAKGLQAILDIDSGCETRINSEIVARCPTYSNFEQDVLDALQIAYKITANSLYGQIGARTSPIYLKDIAACTTATGRERIMMAKDFVETQYGAEVIYGDTDSIFCRFPNKDPITNEPLTGKDALRCSIAAGQRASKEIKRILPHPQCLEYEKTFFPFIIFSKKRYVGNLYEDDADKKPKQKSMGIVLKRRDNAPIVKEVYGGIIDILLNQQNFDAAVDFFNTVLSKLTCGEVPLDNLIISKTLRGHYKDPQRIAHKVLAERMGERDPGNKPMVNDRIPYVYTLPMPDQEIKLQGDRIEHPDHIKEHNLTPDYLFYITNQIMKPVCQIFALCVERIEGYAFPPSYWMELEEELKHNKIYKDNAKKREDKMTQMRMKAVQLLLFQPFIDRLSPPKPPKAARAAGAAKPQPTQRGQKTITAFFKAGGDAMSMMKGSLPSPYKLHITVAENKETKQYDTHVALQIDEHVFDHKRSYPKKARVMDLERAFLKCLEYVATEIVSDPELRARCIKQGIQLICDKKYIRLVKTTLNEVRGLAEKTDVALKCADPEQIKENQKLMFCFATVKYFIDIPLQY